jgi:spore maturation protein CgeB
VYGKSWTPERLDPRYLAGEHIPNAELAGYYAGAAIVLNDHWLDMQREGFMSNRLYDAAAAGGFVISDDIAGLAAEFDGGIVGYVEAAELRELIDHYLAHPEERGAMADRARRAVLERHTFDHRARRLMDAIEPELARRPLTIGRDVGGASVEAAR